MSCQHPQLFRDGARSGIVISRHLQEAVDRCSQCTHRRTRSACQVAMQATGKQEHATQARGEWKIEESNRAISFAEVGGPISKGIYGARSTSQTKPEVQVPASIAANLGGSARLGA